MQQSSDRRGANRPPLLLESRGQLRPALARPSQWRHRISASHRIHKGFQRRLQTGLSILQRGSTSSWPTYSPRSFYPLLNLTTPATNRLPSDAGRLRHQCIPAISNRVRLSCAPEEPCSLIEDWRYRDKLCDDECFERCIPSHVPTRSYRSSVSKIIVPRGRSAANHLSVVSAAAERWAALRGTDTCVPCAACLWRRKR